MQRSLQGATNAGLCALVCLRICLLKIFLLPLLYLLFSSEEASLTLWLKSSISPEVCCHWNLVGSHFKQCLNLE